MGTTSNGRPDEPVFVDSSGGRSRRWRRLGWMMGVAGGGYALVLAVSVIGGNSDAPWVLIPGTDRDASGSVRVAPERTDDTDTGLPAAQNGAGRSGGPSASASASSGNGTRTSTGSDDATAAARESSGTRAKTTPIVDSVSGGSGGGGPKAPPAGVPAVPDPEPPQPTDPPTTDEPAEPPEEPPGPTTPESGDGGLLGGLLDGLGLGGAGVK